MADVYDRLRERLDMFPQGFTKTKSGVELEILKRLFRPEEAEIMLSLRPGPEKVPDIAKRLDKDETELGKTLYDMSKRGLIMRWRAPNKDMYYFLIPWIVGIWEFQLKNLTQENIEVFEKYYEEGMVPSWRNRKIGTFRVIPVQKEIQGGTEIQPYEKVSQIIESNTKICRGRLHLPERKENSRKGMRQATGGVHDFWAGGGFLYRKRSRSGDYQGTGKTDT